MTHPSHAHFLLFCEEGLPSGMFLSGGRLTTFLDSARVLYQHISPRVLYLEYQTSRTFLQVFYLEYLLHTPNITHRIHRILRITSSIIPANISSGIMHHVFNVRYYTSSIIPNALLLASPIFVYRRILG